jgi:hypothetical protein
MAQHDYIIANQSGAAFRSDLNNGLAAIVSQNSGAAQPSTTYAYQWWAETTTGLLKIRNAANNAWITVGTLAGVNLGLLAQSGGTLTGALLADYGTAALPGVAFDGDPDTGVFRAAANKLGIATNGVERVEFGNTEVVFNDDGADVDFRVEGDTNADLFKIDAGLDQVQVANLNGGQLAGFRNRIINGNFDIWQRGTSFNVTNTATYTADRWRCRFNGSGGTRTLSQSAFGLGQTAVQGQPKYYLRYAQTGAGSGATYNQLEQRIEGVSTFAGQQVTISFYAKRLGGSFTLPSLSFAQVFGTGGSPSATEYLTFGADTAITTSFTKYSFTVDIPSIAGKVLGSTGDDYLAVRFGLPVNAAFTLDIAQVQIEPGPVATPFEQRPIGVELALCKRYAQWVPFSQQFYASGAVTHESTLSWPEMRTNPNAAALTADPNTANLALNNSSNVISRVTPYGGSAILVATAAGSAYLIGYRSFLSAEL